MSVCNVNIAFFVTLQPQSGRVQWQSEESDNLLNGLVNHTSEEQEHPISTPLVSKSAVTNTRSNEHRKWKLRHKWVLGMSCALPGMFPKPKSSASFGKRNYAECFSYACTAYKLLINEVAGDL